MPPGVLRKAMPSRFRKSARTSRETSVVIPDMGRMKYSIIPLVSGWPTSKRDSSPSVSTSIPASSWVFRITLAASIRLGVVG